MKKRFALVAAIVISITGWSSAQSSVSASSTFNDVPNSYRAYTEITFLSKGGIVQGTLDGNFNPGKNVTRAEAVTMLGRALDYNGEKTMTKFPDVSKGSFASGYVKAAVAEGIISGYPDGTFKPNNPIKRGEMALIISRAFGFGSSTIPDSIQSIMNNGIAQGLANGTFGSEQPITRADFSVFLARAIDIDYRVNYTPHVISMANVTANWLNVRTGPLATYDTAGGLSQNSEVEIVNRIGKWAQIIYNNQHHFVHAGYLNNGGETSNNDPIEKKQLIVLDAGHGGTDPGAGGNGLVEKSINLDTALRVENYLKQAGMNVYLTRRSDTKLELSERVQLATLAGGTEFVSIHANSGGGTGTETYYYKSAFYNPHVEESNKLATAIQNRLIEAWGLKDRGVKVGNFHVIREINMPAALVELGFIDSANDSQKLGSEYWRDKAAKAIYLGILDYYNEK